MRLYMIRPDLEDLPDGRLPSGYSIRGYEEGDEEAWLDIHRQADSHNGFPQGRFEEEFGGAPDLLPERQVYLLDAAGAPVGTATGWFDPEFREGDWGRVHWVAIRPNEQGKGLSRPLLAEVLRRLRRSRHRRAYLTTATFRLPAIRLYLRSGFYPAIATPAERAAWDRLRTEHLDE